MTTKRCNKCQLVKSISEFARDKSSQDGFTRRCKHCFRTKNAEVRQGGLQILQSLAMDKGCCAHCERPYSNEDWHFFEFDHIDSRLKKSRKETELHWVMSHRREFFERVAPNLQLLCVKCHKLKTTEENKVGGAVHEKKYGQSQPAEVLDPGWDLFHPVPVGGPDELKFEYTALLKEGDWITVRDIDGNLIRYEPYSNYIKQ